MSAHYSFLYSDRACILSDQGVWDANGNLAAIRQKVCVSPTLPFAVFLQGKPVEKLAQIIDDMDAWINKHGDRLGRDRVLACLPAIEDYFQDLGRREGQLEAQFLFVGFSKAAGPQQWLLRCNDRFAARGVLPYSLFNPGREVQSGPPVTMADLTAGLGIDPSEVLQPDFPDRYGARFMSIARQKEEDVPGEGRRRIVGGGCDLATITAEGVTVKTLCRWNDEIGKPIDPSLPMLYPAEVAA